ncbi:MAG: hypothetical protein RIT28_2187 [Pseudomonadota bacterium]
MSARLEPFAEDAHITGAMVELPLIEEPTAPDFGWALAQDDAEHQRLAQVARRCQELNPLAAAELPIEALHAPITGEQLVTAFYRGAARWRAERFSRGSPEAQRLAVGLAELLAGARESLRFPTILAQWLRELRLACPPPSPPGDAARATAIGLARQAIDLARGARWAESQALADRSATLHPRLPRARVVQIVTALALGRMSLVDGALNLQALAVRGNEEASAVWRLAGELLRVAKLHSLAERLAVDARRAEEDAAIFGRSEALNLPEHPSTRTLPLAAATPHIPRTPHSEIG